MWLSGVNLQVYTKNRFYWATYAYMYLNNFLLTHIMKSNTLQNDQNEETMLSSTLSHFFPVHVTFYTHFIRISLLSSLWPINYVPSSIKSPPSSVVSRLGLWFSNAFRLVCNLLVFFWLTDISNEIYKSKKFVPYDTRLKTETVHEIVIKD